MPDERLLQRLRGMVNGALQMPAHLQQRIDPLQRASAALQEQPARAFGLRQAAAQESSRADRSSRRRA